jgi:DNA-binding helix-hairpin-helix protein with protein kinase domain
MLGILKPQQAIRTEFSGMTCVVEDPLGGGSQGEVYRANLGGKTVALKWYFPASATPDQRIALEMLVKRGAPNDKFLWPMELASAEGVSGFGYIMPLREPRYKGIVDLMKRRVEPSFRTLATAGLDLSHSFLQLHAKGLCYRDISFGNVFFDPNSGDILICDNDNVAADGEAKGGVLGTPRFIAPEVVRGEALPSTRTDLFSLAVLLFYMLIMHHPLEGKKEAAIRCLDLPAMTKIYGTEPLFIFDPNDDSNRPVPGYHDNALVFWSIYPQFLCDLFIKSFTDGIRDPQNGRVGEGQWRAAMVRLRDSIVYCPHCGTENFYDTAQKGSPGAAPACWQVQCKRDIQLPAHIRLEKQIVMLNRDAQLFPHHVDDRRMYDFSQPVAAVTQHPTDPRIWGLKNMSGEKWVITTNDGKIREVESGRSVTLAVGTKINFGKVEGVIQP